MCSNTWNLRTRIRIRTRIRWRLARTLKKEIIMALILKVILLSTLWMLCFHDPIEKHLTTQSIKQHWYSVQK